MRDHTLRGGKTMAFTSNDGADHPESFWCLENLLAKIGDSGLRLRFIGYHDVDAYNADKEPVAGAVKEYAIYGEGFAAAIALQTLGQALPISNEIIRLAWAVALAQLDTEGVSFFNGAVDAA